MQLPRLAASFLITSLALAPAALGQAPEGVRIRGVSYAGTACPAGTVAAHVAPDGQALVLHLEAASVQIGQLTIPRGARKNCQLLLDVEHPLDWSFALDGYQWRGYADLDAGVRLTSTIAAYYGGAPTTTRLTAVLDGPVQSDVELNPDDPRAPSSPQTELVWSPCGVSRALNANVSIGLASRAPRAEGSFGPDSIDEVAGPLYLRLAWRHCGR
jgi:hypothetical protein